MALLKFQTIRLKTHEVPVTIQNPISADEATRDKGFQHPGNMLDLPVGPSIPMQYNQNPAVERNGNFEADILSALASRLKVFQSGSMSTPQTAKAIEHIELAIMYLDKRQLDRLDRGVQGTDNK